ncbi:MAG: dUTP diphosphatase [Hydrogenothermaceae bacterium]|nr:dUTP diphosphatase [Hydrogenothermaceae bacterium]
MKDRLSACLQLQDSLNSQINLFWKEERTEEEFYRAIWTECAEALDSLPWKWWKNMSLDMKNLEIEIADIFHFILSLSILKFDDELLYFKKALTSDFSNLSKVDGECLNHYLADLYKGDKVREYIFLIERVAEYSLRGDYDNLLFFFGLLVRDTIGFERLYLLYFGKNILNRIRQEMGYKGGSYNKTTNGVEDNRYLLEVINRVENIETLEKEIREAFKRLHQETRGLI